MSVADRRTILGAVAFAALGGWPRPALAAMGGSWRRARFETRIRPPASIAGLRAGAPVLSLVPGEHRLEGIRILGDADRIDRRGQERGVVLAEWRPGALDPRLDVIFLLSIRDGAPAPLRDAGAWIETASGRCALSDRHWLARWTAL